MTPGERADGPGLIVLLSGPNLNLLGEREPAVYGTATLGDHVAAATAAARELGYGLEHHQSNHEGDLVELVHGARGRAAAIIVNAGALTHTSWSLHDTLAAFDGVVVELHLSNPGGPGALPARLGGGPGGRRLHRRVRWARLPPGHRGRAPRPDRPGGDVVTPVRARDDGRRPGAARLLGSAGSPADRFPDAGVDALLVTTPPNVRWLTGFTGSAGLLLVTPDRAVLTTDGRYRTQSAEQTAAAGVGDVVEVVVGGVQDQRGAVVAAAGGRSTVGLEADHVSWSASRRGPDCSVTPGWPRPGTWSRSSAR